MKDKNYYNQKIAKAKSDIELYEFRIKSLETPTPLKAVKEATKGISVRVPASVADICLFNIKNYLIENDFFQSVKCCGRCIPDMDECILGIQRAEKAIDDAISKP